MRWIFSLILGTDTGACIDPQGGCSRAGLRIDDNG